MSNLFSSIDDAPHTLPVPPLRLRRVYLQGVGPAGARFDPLDLDFATKTGAASRVLLSLGNTGGKSTLITLITSLIVPAARDVIGGRQLGDYLLTMDTAHVLCEWEDAGSDTRVVTGCVMEWKDGRRQPPEDQRSTSKMHRRWYLFRTGNNLPSIDDLPFLTGSARTPYSDFIAALNELFAEHPNSRGASATTQSDWGKALIEHTNLDPVLFGFQMRMNDSEAGAEALLSTFNSPENVVRFFVGALTNEQLTADFTKNLGDYANLASKRPQLEMLAAFCETVGPRVDLIAAKAIAAASARAVARREQIRGAELHASIASRVDHDEGMVDGLAAAAAEAAVVLATLRQEENQLPDIRRQLNLERGRAHVTKSQTACDEAVGRSTIAAAEHAGWAAVDDLVRLDRDRFRRNAAKAALELVNSSLDPLRADVTAAAEAYAGRLDALIAETDGAAGREREAEKAAEELHESFVTAGTDAALAARAAESDLRAVAETVRSASDATAAAVTSGRMKLGEEIPSAITRWEGDLSTAQEQLESLLERTNLARDNVETHDRAAKGVNDELIGLRSTRQSAESELSSFENELDAIASDSTVVELLGGRASTPADVDRASTAAAQAAGAADARANEHEQVARDADLQVAHLIETGTALAGPDVISVKEALIAANIGASTGLEWIEQNIAEPTRRAEFIAACPEAAGGVIIHDRARFDAGVAVLVAAELRTRTPVAVTTAPTGGVIDPATARHVVIPDRATWDREWATTMLAELKFTTSERGAAGRKARENAATLRLAGSTAAGFVHRWKHTTHERLETKSLGAAGDVAIAEARAASIAKAKAGQLALASALETQSAATRSTVESASTALSELRPVAILADDAAGARARRSGLEQDRTTALRDKEAADTGRVAAKAASRAAMFAAQSYRSQGSAMARERDEVTVDSPLTDPGGNSDILRNEWRTLAKELDDAQHGLTEASALTRAEETYVESKRRFEVHTTEAGARALELAASLDGASEDIRRESLARALAELNAATTAKIQTAEDLKRAKSDLVGLQPADSTRPNHADLATTPRWLPSSPEEVPGILAKLESRLAELRTAREAASTAHSAAQALYDSVLVDIKDMRTTLELWAHSVEGLANIDRFDGSKDIAQSEMIKAFTSFRDAEGTASAAVTALADAIKSARAVANQLAWKDLESALTTRIRELDDARFAAEAPALAHSIESLHTSTTGDLANMNEHRSILRENLITLCSEQRALLRSINSASRLPEGLGSLTGQSAIKIGFEAAPEDESAGRLADRIDRWTLELAKDPKRSSQTDVRTRWIAEAVGDTVVNRPKAGRFTVEVLKPRTDGQVSFCQPSRIPKEFSGGQELTLAVLVFCALAKVRAQSRRGGARPAGALLLDNPFGAASAEVLIDMQHRLAAHSGVQLIGATGLLVAGVEEAFTGEGSVILKLRNDADLRRNLKFVHIRSRTAGHDASALLTTSRPVDDPNGYVAATGYQVAR